MKKETDDDVAIRVRGELMAFLKFKLRDRDDAGRMLGVHYLEQSLWKWFQDLHSRNSDKFPYKVQSRYIAHALNEFKLLPKSENELDKDLQEWLQASVLDLLFILSQQRHSGGTLADLISLFLKLVNFEALSPITNNPAEWEDMQAIAGRPIWQNKRESKFMSEDGGLTYYDIRAEKPYPITTSEPCNDAV